MRGRIRTVKPELFSDEQLWDLELETGLPLLRVFVGLWCYCDREGRFEWAPRALRGSIAPCWSGDMSAALEALASKLYVVRYTVNGKDYGYVRSFKEHQAINNKEQASVLPAPEEHATATREPRVGHATLEGERGREGKGMVMEGNGTDLRARADMSVPNLTIERIPEDWIPSPELLVQVELGGCSRTVFDARLADLRTGPIGGRRRVFADQLDRYILARAMEWKSWAAAAPANGPRGSPALPQGAIMGRDGRGYPLVLEASQKHHQYAAKHGVDLPQVMASIAEDGIIDKLGLERAREVIGERLAKLARGKAKQCQTNPNP